MINKNLKVLVTGAEGFIGKHLVKFLLKKNVTVTPITRKQGDIRNLDLNTYKNHDQVIHLANRNHIPTSWENPGEFFSTNLDGTRNVLEYCRNNKVRLVYLSAYVYGQPEYLPINEEHPISGINPYMKSKVLAEQLIKFYSEYLGVSSVIVRPFNIYGNQQNESFLIPTILSQLKKDIKIQVHSLKPKRDFLHVEDFAAAISQILTNNHLTGVYNVGSGQSFSVEEIIQFFSQILNKKIEYSENNVERPHEVLDVIADISKIETDTGWSPNLSMKEGLSKLLAEVN